MSKFDTVRERYKGNSTSQSASSVSKFDSFRSRYEEESTQNNGLTSPEKEYSLGNRAASLAKSATAGALGAVPDTAALAYNLPAMGINTAMRSTDTSQPFDDDGVIPQLPQNMGGSFANVTQNKRHDLGEQAPQLPLIPSATHAISEGIDNLSDGYTETSPQDKALNQGVEFAAGVGGGGAAALARRGGKNGVEKVANFAGSTNPWHIGGAGVAGAAMSNAENNGDSTLSSLGQGAGAQLAVSNAPALTKGLSGIGAKGLLAVAGLGKNKLNLDAAKAGQDLGINLPKAVVSDGKAIAYADRFLSHAPIAGNIMQKRYANIGTKVLKELDNAYESVISSKELVGIEDRISKLYTKAQDTLPANAEVVPKNTLRLVNEIREQIKAPALSGDFAKLNTKINQIEKEFAPSNKKGIPASTKTLVNQKENLNNSIYTDLNTSKGQKLLGDLNNAIRDDIAEYGKSNPEWHQYFTQADALFSKKSQRKDLEKLLTGKAESYTHGDITYGALSKVLNTPESKDKLKGLVKPEIFERMEKLGIVTQALAKKNKDTINPSGTAVAQTTINWISALAGLGGYKTGAIEPLTATGTLIGASGLAHLLTDKKTLDLAIKFAETGTEKAAVAFNVRMKAITGYTPVTLARETAKREQDKQEKSGTGLKKKFNDHIDENKKRPKSQALKKLLNNPSVQKGAELLGANPWKQ